MISVIFSGFLHEFVLAKLAISSIRVNLFGKIPWVMPYHLDMSIYSHRKKQFMSAAASSKKGLTILKQSKHQKQKHQLYEKLKVRT